MGGYFLGEAVVFLLINVRNGAGLHLLPLSGTDVGQIPHLARFLPQSVSFLPTLCQLASVSSMLCITSPGHPDCFAATALTLVILTFQGQVYVFIYFIRELIFQQSTRLWLVSMISFLVKVICWGKEDFSHQIIVDTWTTEPHMSQMIFLVMDPDELRQQFDPFVSITSGVKSKKYVCWYRFWTFKAPKLISAVASELQLFGTAPLKILTFMSNQRDTSIPSQCSARKSCITEHKPVWGWISFFCTLVAIHEL